MVLAIPRVKPFGWATDEVLKSALVTQMDINISLLDSAFVRTDHAAMQMHRTDLATSTSRHTQLSAVLQTSPVGPAAYRQKSILTSGATGAGTILSWQLLNDGCSPGFVVNFGGTNNLTCAPASDENGILFGATVGGGAIQSSNGGTSTSSVTITGATGEIGWVGRTGTRWLAFEPSTQKLFQCATLGGTWTNVTLPVSSIADLVVNGLGTLVLVGGTVVPFVLYSTNDGATWTPYGSIGPTATASGCWSVYYSVFLIMTSAGSLWASASGTTGWAVIRNVTDLAGLAFNQNKFAACGQVIACVANRAVNSNNKYPVGLAYSFDLGANWFETWFGNPIGSYPIGHLISANSRFYAVDGVSLFRSELLEQPLIPSYIGT